MVTLLGWVGALLALAAYAQTRVKLFRQIALLSSVALWTFAFILHIWSNVALESALGIVNLRRLLQLQHPTWTLRGRRNRTESAAAAQLLHPGVV